MIPDVTLERFRLGELPPREHEQLAALVREDASLQARLDALAASDEVIAGEAPFASIAARVRARHRPPAPAGRHSQRILAASALTLGIVAVAMVRPWTWIAPPDDGDRIKGLRPAITVYRRTAEGSEVLADGAPARAGDLLRLGYVAAGQTHGVILSIDGRGSVTRHLPPDGASAAPLDGGGIVLLATAYELDDAPAWERFYFITATHPFDVSPILEAARRAASPVPRVAPAVLPLGKDLSQTTFSIQKEVTP